MMHVAWQTLLLMVGLILFPGASISGSLKKILKEKVNYIMS